MPSNRQPAADQDVAQRMKIRLEQGMKLHAEIAAAAGGPNVWAARAAPGRSTSQPISRNDHLIMPCRRKSSTTSTNHPASSG